ncbi:MAG: gamma carbonic anhydrase family protein [Planctomycetota bacterium]
MLIEHEGKKPRVHPTAFVAPNAVLCGNVVVGPGSRVMHGAQLIAEGRRIILGERCVVLQNAVLRSTARHPLVLGDGVLVGPQAHLVGCVVDRESACATSATVLHGAVIGEQSEVRVDGVVHANTRLPARSMVPIGWVAVGNPAEILAPSEHESIWRVQRSLDFPTAAYGLERSEATGGRIACYMSCTLEQHTQDTVLNGFSDEPRATEAPQ